MNDKRRLQDIGWFRYWAIAKDIILVLVASAIFYGVSTASFEANRRDHDRFEKAFITFEVKNENLQKQITENSKTSAILQQMDKRLERIERKLDSG